MPLCKVLVTGSCGLVGSEAVQYFSDIGCEIVGIDNNSRKIWFGPEGDTNPVRNKLCQFPNYTHFELNIAVQHDIEAIVKSLKPDLVIHCAGQPSHEYSAKIPHQDFEVNALGTVNVLEAVRIHCPDTPIIFTSTNKVYGDQPNQLPIGELATRYEYSQQWRIVGLDERMSVDQTLHSPFGASKVAADIMVQEYARYFGLKTVCFRCGCITGSNQQGVEQHGFLSYLCKAAKQEKVYTIYGHKGKQVRDNIHAYDLVRAFHLWAENPRSEVYNMGGGYENSCSIVEAIATIQRKTGIVVKTQHNPARVGDHICYYTNWSKFISHYPQWEITQSLDMIFDELLAK